MKIVSGTGALTGVWLLVADPGRVKKSRSVPGMTILNQISKGLATFFWVKILKFFDADPGIFLTLDPGWTKKIWIRNKNPRSATLTDGT
jgi:hypothetical protein